MCADLPSAPARALAHCQSQGTRADGNLLTGSPLPGVYGPRRSPWRAGLCLKLQAAHSYKAVLTGGTNGVFLENWSGGC